MWLSLITILMQLPAALDLQLQRDNGLTFYEYSVLVGLTSAGDDGLRMTDLAMVTSGQLPRLSQVITRMEGRGWVIRRKDPDDGRATRVVIQSKGRELLERAAPRHVARVRELIFDQLSATQLKNLKGIARTISLGLGEPHPLLEERRRALGG